MQLGDFNITPVTDGYFRLDAGSMFGIVPRAVWEKKIQPDDRHRIRLAVRCLLVRNGSRTVLIDSGDHERIRSVPDRRVCSLLEATEWIITSSDSPRGRA